MEQIIMLAFLAPIAWMDAKKQEINLLTIGLMGTVGMFFFVWFTPFDWKNLFGGVLVGGILLLIAFVTKEQIGRGDGLLFCVTGIYLGWRGNLQLLVTSLLLSGIIMAILCALGKVKRGDRVAFSPFVFLSAILSVICSWF